MDMTSKDVILHGKMHIIALLFICLFVYLKGKEKESTQCGIVGPKTKVAPVKQLPIPRSELLAWLMLGNLMNNF